MNKFTHVTGVALPLDIDNLDTDQIIPKQFLRGLDKSGLAQGCLYNLRFLPDGKPNPESIFHHPGFEKAEIIVAGPNFGCGSSREHAVWSLQQLGVRVVIAPSYGEIFYSNCFNNGLLAARVTPEDSRELFSCIGTTHPTTLTVDLEKRSICIDGSDKSFLFTISDRHRTMLLEGLDMVENTLKSVETIESFRRDHESRFPWMSRLAGRTARTLSRRSK